MDFISGSYFKKHCRYRIGEYTSAQNHHFAFEVNEDIDNDYVFCKTEYLLRLINAIQNKEIVLPNRFVLFTHNSDIGICDTFFVLESLPQLRHWYAQNLNSVNSLVSPLPIGIANPKWEHGNTDRFFKIVTEKIFHSTKENIVYVNFNLATNLEERSHCLYNLGSEITTKCTKYPDFTNPDAHNRFTKETQEDYLRDMAASYFVISPNGNGIDCHKTWEALYMKAVPIVTQSVMADEFKKLGIPLLIINDWSEFSSLELTTELYYNIWNNFNIESLNFELFTRGL